MLNCHLCGDTESGNALADLAAKGAQPNAFTSAEMTAYYFECTEAFEENLKTLLNFVSIPYFTAESVAKEQGIIGQEIDMCRDSPFLVGYYNLLKALYSAHPVRDMITGTIESIGEITAETLYALHRAFYRPSNMVLCAAGDIDPQTVIDTARDLLPGDYHEPPVKDYGTADEKPFVRERTEVQMAVAKPLFLAGTRVEPGQRGEAYLKQELAGSLATAYIAGKSSPLYIRLYEAGLIARDFGCGFMNGQSYALTEFYGESQDPDRVLNELREEIAKIPAEPPDEARFSSLKKSLAGRLIRELDNMENLCHSQSESHFRGAFTLDRPAVLESITAADVLAFIQQNLKPEHFALSIVSPK